MIRSSGTGLYTQHGCTRTGNGANFFIFPLAWAFRVVSKDSLIGLSIEAFS